MWIFNKLIYFICSIILIAVMLVMIAAVGIHFIDPNKYRADIVRIINETSGNTITINGPLKLKLLPTPFAQFDDVKLDLPIEGQVYSIKAKTAELNIPFRSFWTNKFNQQSFTLHDVSIQHPLNIVANPYKLTLAKGKFKTTCCSFRLSNTKFAMPDGNTATVDFFVSFLKEKPAVEAQVKVKHFDLSSENKTKGPIFSNEKLDFVDFSKFDIDATIQADSLKLDDYTLTANKFKIVSKESGVSVIHAANAFGGKLSGEYLFKNIKDAINLNWDLSISNAVAAQFIANKHGNSKARGGQLQFETVGNTSGNSMHTLASRAQGQGFLHIENLTILQPHFKTSLGGAFFSTIGNVVKKNNTELKCLVAKFNMNQGILKFDDSLGFETNDAAGVASGVVNLGREVVDISLNVMPKPNLIDVTQMTQSAKISGPITDPEVDVKMASLVKQSGSLVLGIATGGLSLIAQKVLSQVTHDGDVCDELLKR